MTENDRAWQRYFDATDILSQVESAGHAFIDATHLKQFAEREPRLLAKIDTLAERPEIFKRHALTLFPTRNGQYILFADPEAKTYFSIGDECFSASPQAYEPGEDLSAYDSFPGVQRLNESQALDFAFISSLLRKFTRDPNIILAIRGRTFSRAFSFLLPVNGTKVDVNSVQIEVDGGYESKDAIYLFEAKQGKRSDFNIRQLFYPYLEWRQRSQKRIVPIFFVITNGVFHFIEFRFNQLFGDLKVVRSESYTLKETTSAGISLAALLSQTPMGNAPATPFPQADDLDKVVDLLSILESVPATKVEIAEYFEYDERQGDYYGNAAAYLGLAQKAPTGFELTSAGKQLINMQERARRTRALVRAMVAVPALREVFLVWASLGLGEQLPRRDQVAAIIEQHSVLSRSTPNRRATTVLAWLRWVHVNATLTP